MPNNPKSLFIVNDFPPILGGQSEYLYNLCRALPKNQVTVLAPRCANTAEFDKAQDFEIIRKPYLTSIPILEKILKIIGPLILGGGVIFRKEFTMIHCAHILSTGFIGWFLHVCFGKKYMIYTHSADILEHHNNHILKWCMRRICNNAEHVVTNSAFTHDILFDLGVLTEKVILLHPRIDVGRFEKDVNSKSIFEKFNLNNKKIILSINRLMPRKGNDKMIEAMVAINKEVPDAMYVIGGEGPYDSQLKQLIDHHQLDSSVLMAGRLSKEETLQFYQACDVFAMPSRSIMETGDVEGFGMALLEANACGKAVIGGRSGGVIDAVVDGETGYLVDPESPEDIAQKTIMLLHNTQLANKMGQKGKERALNKFDWRQGVPQFDFLFSSEMSNRIKVAHVITRLDPGGSSINTTETVARSDKTKFDSHLICGQTLDFQKNVEPQLKQKGVSFLYLEDLQRAIHPWRDLKAFWQLWRYFCKNKFDIVHTHSSKGGILGRWAAWLAGVKTIIHTPHGHIFYGYYGKCLTRVFIILEQLAALITKKIITLTDIGKQDHIKYRIAPPDKFVTIPSGIDVTVYQNNDIDLNALKQSVGITNGGFIFGSVARLDPIKGNQMIIEAFKDVHDQYPDTHLVLVGDGEEREAIEGKIKAYALENNVKLLGFRDDVPCLLQMMDGFVLASLNEGMGRVILEAMASEKPIIASRTGGIPEIVHNGENGILVNPGNIKELAQAMVNMVEKRQEYAEKGKFNKKCVDERFSLDKMVSDIEKLYTDTLEDVT